MYILKLTNWKVHWQETGSNVRKLRLVNCLQIILLGVFIFGPKSIQIHRPKYSMTCNAQVLKTDNRVNNIFTYRSSFKMWYIWINCGIYRITDSQVTFQICSIEISKYGAWTCTFHKYPQWVLCSKWRKYIIVIYHI